MKLISIVGARPQFIKLAPLCQELIKQNVDMGSKSKMTMEHIIIHTGQHFDEEMSDLFFKQLEIPEPQYNLRINGGNQGDQTGRMLMALEEVLLKENPDLVIVFGDTNSTLAGSLTTAKLKIKCVHVESGLRSFNRSMPEEINRIVADHTSDYLFAPTRTAVENLKNEGLRKKTFLTGDIMVDSLAVNIEKAKQYSSIIEELKIETGKYFLLTLHRPYTVDDPKNLKLILQKIASLKEIFVLPVHPRTKQVIAKNSIRVSDNVLLTNPVGYFDFINLEINATKILTDSGGVQKEAYILKKPCITIRPETEWIETVEDGWNILIQPKDKDFCERIKNFSPNNEQRNVFGSDVAVKMVNKIKEILIEGY